MFLSFDCNVSIYIVSLPCVGHHIQVNFYHHKSLSRIQRGLQLGSLGSNFACVHGVGACTPLRPNKKWFDWRNIKNN